MQRAPDKDFLAGAEMWCANAYFEQGEFVLAQSMYRDAAEHSQRPPGGRQFSIPRSHG